jgi:hypothetical protein
MSLLAACAMSVLIGAYQVRKIQHFDYYFYKSLFTVLFLSIVLYGYLIMRWIAAAALAIEKVEPRQRIVLPTLGLIMVGFMLLAFNLPKSLDRFLTAKYAIPQTLPNRPLDIFTHDHVYKQYSDVIVLNYCNPYTNFTGTIWAGAFFFPYNVQRQKLENSLQVRTGQELEMETSTLLQDIISYAQPKARPVALVGGDCMNLPAAAQLLKGSNVQLVSPEGTKIP